MLLMGERTKYINNNNFNMLLCPYSEHLECTFGNYRIYKVPVELLLTEFVCVSADYGVMKSNS